MFLLRTTSNKNKKKIWVNECLHFISINFGRFIREPKGQTISQKYNTKKEEERNKESSCPKLAFIWWCVFTLYDSTDAILLCLCIIFILTPCWESKYNIHWVRVCGCYCCRMFNIEINCDTFIVNETKTRSVWII